MPAKRSQETDGKASAFKVLDMVRVLHGRGFELLRIMTGRSPSGMHWRCYITHLGNIESDHGAIIKNPELETASYTSAAVTEYFDWDDAEFDSAEELAGKFIERFELISELGLGSDPEYVRWYLEMLEIAREGDFPLSCDDGWDEPDPRWMPTTNRYQRGLSMPPLGGNVNERRG